MYSIVANIGNVSKFHISWNDSNKSEFCGGGGHETRLKVGNACYHCLECPLPCSLWCKKLNIEIYKITLPVVLCGCETWCIFMWDFNIYFVTFVGNNTVFCIKWFWLIIYFYDICEIEISAIYMDDIIFCNLHSNFLIILLAWRWLTVDSETGCMKTVCYELSYYWWLLFTLWNLASYTEKNTDWGLLQCSH